MLAKRSRPLFVFEMANNHMGKVEHGLTIIRELKRVTSGFEFDFAIKFQFRDLDSFVHPAYRHRFDLKYVKRFQETRLSEAEFNQMKTEAEKLGFLTMCTPFDEPSVDLIEKMGFDILKVASCSFSDWSLLEKIVATKLPIIASTAGASVDVMDKVISFFEHRDKDFAIMHCVAEYPTPGDLLHLNQLDFLKNRYPNVRIGYSTHEAPCDTDGIKIALAKGVTLFEKHVGVPTDDFSLNDYSADMTQVTSWLKAAQTTLLKCGVGNQRMPFTEKAISSLNSLGRGVFASRHINKGDIIGPENAYLAFPASPGQVQAQDLSKYTEFAAKGDIEKDGAILKNAVVKTEKRQRVYEIVQKVKELLQRSNAVVPNKLDFEISHHYGLDRFEEYGATILTYINRSYCKKIIVMLPGQKHPEQYHVQKEETFHVLFGNLTVTLNGKSNIHGPGDIVVVEREVRHAFESDEGAVIEEISSRHFKDDSYYTDEQINKNLNRKTSLTYWVEG